MKYLYGAAVQGIQQFIFESNKLREIAEASNIVEKICKEMFAQTLLASEAYGCYERMLEQYPDSVIINAAGNVKFVFADEALCRRVVRNFPKKVMQLVPGITISQAVVPIQENETVDGTAIDELERRLREQRNHIPRNGALGLMAIKRCRKTGKPAVRWINDEAIDQATANKQDNHLQYLCEEAFGVRYSRQLPFNIEEIEGNKKWIAIIHADGNGLGQVVRKIGKDVDTFHQFSQDLDAATRSAAREAFEQLVADGKITLERDGKLQVIPIRPVVLGGDDLTVICRADLAVEFVRLFCQKFEDKTHFNYTIKDKETIDIQLTCCAGIAFVKSNYPFHYGYELAEQLCKAAKDDARKIADKTSSDSIPSCLVFHKVQDSFIKSYKDIQSRELSISKDKIEFANGPYYLKKPTVDSRWSIEELTQNADKLNKENKIAKNAIRQWLSDMAQDHAPQAQQRLDRMLTIKEPQSAQLIRELTTPHRNGVYPAYDVMSLTAILK